MGDVKIVDRGDSKHHIAINFPDFGMIRHWHPNMKDERRNEVGRSLLKMGKLLVLSVAFLGGTDEANKMSVEDMKKRVEKFKLTSVYSEFRDLAAKTTSLMSIVQSEV